jgi:hypothetical protein
MTVGIAGRGRCMLRLACKLQEGRCSLLVCSCWPIVFLFFVSGSKWKLVLGGKYMKKFVVSIVGLCVILSGGLFGLPVYCLAGSSADLGERQLNSPDLFDKISGISTATGGCRFDNPSLCGTTRRPSAGPGDCPFNTSNLCDRIDNVTTFNGPFTFDRSRVGARGSSTPRGGSCFPCFRPFHP